MKLSRKIDLTDDRAFSSRRLPRKISLSPLPWYDVEKEYKGKIAAWFRNRLTGGCERCGAGIRRLPWQTTLPGLCRRCSELLTEPEPLWKTTGPADAYEAVFLSEYSVRSRGEA